MKLKRMPTPEADRWIALATVILVACQEDKVGIKVSAVEQDQLSSLALGKRQKETRFIPINTPPGKNPFPVNTANQLSEPQKEQFKQWMLQLAPISARIESVTYNVSLWQEADGLVREFLQSIKDNPLAYQIEQKAASKMLTDRLLDAETTPASQEAIEYYTQRLLDNAHSDADVISRSLDALEGKWTRDQIARAAANTAKHARAYLKTNPCRPCLEGTKAEEKLLDARQRKLYKMQNALFKLDILAKRL